MALSQGPHLWSESDSWEPCPGLLGAVPDVPCPLYPQGPQADIRTGLSLLQLWEGAPGSEVLGLGTLLNAPLAPPRE